MAGKPRPRPASGPAGVALPPIGTARFQQAAILVQRLSEANQDVFLEAAQRFRVRHREATSRPLTYMEAAHVANALSTAETDKVKVAETVQASDLAAYDEPQPSELLIASGMATAPAFFDVAKQLVGLIEMPADEFMAAYKAQRLEEAVGEYVAREFDDIDLPMEEAIPRASAAFNHWARAAGQGSAGEALGLLTKLVGQAYSQAMQTLSPTLTGSGSSSLIGSPPNTGGDSTPSSSTSDTPTP